MARPANVAAEVIISGGPCAGKCVHEETPLLINGREIPAREVWELYAGDPIFDGEGWWAEPTAPITTASLDSSGKMVMAPVTRLYRQKVDEDGLHVTLNDNSEITMTRRHRLHGVDGWLALPSVGDAVCVPIHIPWSGKSLDPDLTTLLAWQIAEGCEDPGIVTISQKNRATLRRVREAAQRVGQRFGIEMNSLPISAYRPMRPSILALSSVSYQRFLEATFGYPWGNRSAGKVIPAAVVAADTETVRLFLREFAAAEGSMSGSTFEISSASRSVVDALRLMYRRFGVLARIAPEEKWATNGTRTARTYYALTVTGPSLRTLLESVGIADKRKEEKLRLYCNKKSRGFASGVPVADLLSRLKPETGLGRKVLGASSSYLDGMRGVMLPSRALALSTHLGSLVDGSYSERISQKTGKASANYARVADKLEDPDVKTCLEDVRQQLARRASREVFYPTVENVEEVRLNGWVYDLEVAEHHNYVAGGIITHNTSSMAYLQEHLSQLGYRVLIVPEVATMFITGGIADIGHLATNRPDIYLDVQLNLVMAQVELRRRFLALAESFPEDRIVILHDRGPMDARAYMSAEQFEAVMAESGLGYSELRDSYDAVLHLVTAAKGAEEAYTLENNAARQESAKQAKDADQRTLHSWIGHPHLRVIDSGASFEGKLKRVLAEVLHLLGEPEPLEVERKFLLAAAPDLSKLPHTQAIEIEQRYLTSEDPTVVRRVRRRSQQGGGATYYLTEKRRMSTGETIEKEQIISARQYVRELQNADPSKATIKKTRYCFAYKNSYFELDQFHTPPGLWLLEVELSSADQEIVLPTEFLWIAKEVSDDPAFKNETLAGGIR